MIEAKNYQTENFKIVFTLNRGTFFAGVNPELSDYIIIADKICNYLRSGKLSDFAGFEPRITASEKKIVVTIKKAILNEDDINDIIKLLDSVYLSYLVSANVKV